MQVLCESTTDGWVKYDEPRFAHLIGQEVGDSHGTAEAVRDATFVDERQPCARVSQGPLWGQTYSRHVELAVRCVCGLLFFLSKRYKKSLIS